SSADWMNRNMMRRVEIAWPIVDAKNRARILQECCQIYLDDNQDAWLLNADGTYVQSMQNLSKSKEKLNEQVPVFSAQQRLIQKYAE
ncbi:MAG TPA: polyphosphate kinase 1, partial [Methylotenera sp.]|nr:polyphosphate kinase 1 [Methylotenera sp.]